MNVKELCHFNNEELIGIINNQQLTITKAMAVIKINKKAISDALEKNRALLKEIGDIKNSRMTAKGIDKMAMGQFEIIENPRTKLNNMGIGDLT